MYLCSLITIKINAMEGCFKWLVILILVLIFVPIIIGGGLLAALIAFLGNIFADGEATLGFIFFVMMVVVIIALANG